ncbi:hypothetical protein SAMN04488540_12921 [Ferrimonas sediminum]|uniref:CpXC protein n=1 Tax=Ferrimonas sediminum TaxID=718193 RepID=A0A1G9BFM6_9GAMM|nr:hypothetical protein [Ferrimonas sediminum]SDK38338.1 hypothetical protein SAMN04488540_12921 [Ferrimonas sediminum]
MKYGPETYLICSDCGGELIHRPLVAVDARFATLWSDGYVDSPTVPEQPLVARCGHCQMAVWLPELAVNPDGGGDACEYQPLTLAETQSLLDHHVSQPSDYQLHLRVKLWHQANHRYRNDSGPGVDWTEAERANMEALLAILDMHQVQERLMATELLRQLGQYESASALLDRQFEGMALDVVGLLRQQLDQRHQRVFRCQLDQGADTCRAADNR